MRYYLFIFIIGIAACVPVKHKYVVNSLKEVESRFQDHKGFMLYDPESKQELISYRADKYYIPASNTKVLTLFASLQIIGDSIPALYYTERGDSLIIQGSGDPSFLYRYVHQNANVFDFLKYTQKIIYFSADNFQTAHFGPGWAWNDYNYAYSPERSAFPVYGNVFKVSKAAYQNTLQIDLPIFKKYFWLGDSLQRTPYVMRDIGTNRIDYFPGIQTRDMSWQVPFKTSADLLVDLLADTLKREVRQLRRPVSLSQKKIIYSIPADSLYKVMMEESDNFIAEQLLLVCAGLLSDTLNPDITIKYLQENYFQQLPDRPVWVDGSGLSRYNLTTPRSMVKLWEMLYQQIPHERLIPLLATGGISGTLKSNYKAEQPYVFGKTGTLRNNHNLSGFIKTKSGRMLIFSFMNNNFTTAASEVRAEMEQILQYIRDNY
ncbi:MAG TPA: D-alanyl-D-alanine carboxypeptidase [Cyclobacteriaceae bacterium]|nr:D-alanyl-D-alanine carboxypeptidase [Cyclobacteriaceae bacterium]